MTMALRIHKTGGPEVLQWEPSDVGEPGPNEVRLRHGAVGFNSLDVDQRSGSAAPKSFPAIIGIEGAGTITALGASVSDWRVGDRAAYPLATGAYSEERTIGAEKIVRVPDDVGDLQAATVLTKGLTVYQLFRVANLTRGDTILFHSAAGGVGLLACQWAQRSGINLIGTVGDPEKVGPVIAAGATHAVARGEEGVAEAVARLTKGRGCKAVFDGVGRDTIESSLRCLSIYGTLVRFGDISGDATTNSSEIPVSTYFTKASILTLLGEKEMYQRAVKAVWDQVRNVFRTADLTTYPLREAAAAHRDLEARRNVGPIALIP